MVTGVISVCLQEETMCQRKQSQDVPLFHVRLLKLITGDFGGCISTWRITLSCILLLGQIGCCSALGKLLFFVSFNYPVYY